MEIKEKIKKLIPSFFLSFYYQFLPALGAFFYRFPSRLRRGSDGQAEKLKVIGITGTNGKSTVVDFVSKILNEAGYKVASISSIKFKIRDKEWQNNLKMTMPGRLSLQRFLRKAVDSGCQYAVLEVTSEGIKQFRHKFIDFDIAVFTNLTPEHIEAHGSFENYRQAKAELFQATKGIQIINLNDENSKYFLKFSSNQKFCYSLNNNLDTESLKIDCKLEIENCKFIKAANVNTSFNRIDFVVKNIPFHLNLLGSFNVYNALAAICVGLSQGIDLKICKKALEKIKGIPGRMETVIEKPFKVIVDYAHTPDALEKVYRTLKTNNYQLKTARMICVLGSCGGGRDKWKRPIFAKIAAKYCQQIILTNEDPYSEDPLKILEDIEKGFSQIPNSKFQIPKYEKILDRKEAINKALSLAKPNDIVIITGKGCEPWMCVAGGKKIPWDDRQVVREQLGELKIKSQK